MYCKYCGEHNSKDETYCVKCGSMIKSNNISPEEISLTESKSTFCKKCGSQVEDRYCTECGSVAYSLELGKGARSKSKPMESPINLGSIEDSIEGLKSKIGESNIGNVKSVDDVKEIIQSNPIIKSSAISALKILGIGLLISFIIFAMISKTDSMQSILHSIDMAANYSYPQISKVKPNFIDLFNISLLSPINLTANLSGEDYGEKISVAFKMLISFKFLILLLIPMIGVLISQLKSFKDENSTESNLLNYGVTSVIFSILIRIISFIGQKSIKIEDPYDTMRMVFKMGFKSLWSLITVAIIIFVIHIILSMIIKKDNPFEALNIKACPQLGNRINTYIKSMAAYIGILSIGLVLTFVFIISKNGLKSMQGIILGIIALPTAFANLWLLAFGNGIVTSATRQMPMTLNIGKMWKGIGSIKALSFGSSTAWAIWGYILIISIFLGLIYVLYKTLKDIEKENYFVKLAYIAGSISIINLLMTYLSSTAITVAGKSSASGYEFSDLLYEMGLGFLGNLAGSGALKTSYSLLTIIITSFIWVFAIGAVIYFAREQDIYGKIIDIIEEHNLKLIIGYSVLIVASSYLLQSKILNELTYEIMNIFPLLDMLL